jgi:hypothetical protein
MDMSSAQRVHFRALSDDVATTSKNVNPNNPVARKYLRTTDWTGGVEVPRYTSGLFSKHLVRNKVGSRLQTTSDPDGRPQGFGIAGLRLLEK